MKQWFSIFDNNMRPLEIVRSQIENERRKRGLIERAKVVTSRKREGEELRRMEDRAIMEMINQRRGVS